MLIFDTKASSNRRGRVDSSDFEYYFPENEKNKISGSAIDGQFEQSRLGLCCEMCVNAILEAVVEH